MAHPALPRRRACAVLLACAMVTGGSTAANGVGIASATVLPSPLSATVTLYVRTAPGPLCTGSCAGAPAGTLTTVARTTPVALDPDGIAQFTLFGDTASNYVVRLNETVYGNWTDRIATPIVLEPALSRGGRLSIVVGKAPSGVIADAFQVVVNYN